MADINKSESIYTSYYETIDSVIEEIYDPDLIPNKQFAVYSKTDRTVEYKEEIEIEKGVILKPIQALIDKRVILLPSEALEYSSETTLIEDIKKFIHTYLDVHQFYEDILPYYILMSWVFDNLSAVPYLRAQGHFGAGKTRFIHTVGSLCYKPMFLAGATSDAYIFRVIEMFGGTIVINELERVNSDMQSQITIILNNGYEKGMPVGRVEGDRKKEPRTFDVFCPKVFSTIKKFDDQALESRIINVPMRQTDREDIPTFLPDGFWLKATELRNKLLMYRFKHLHNNIWNESDNKRKEKLLTRVEPRLKQTLLPLLYVIKDPKLESEFISFAKEFQKQLVDVRGEGMTGLVFQKLHEVYMTNGIKVSVKEVTIKVNSEIENEKAKLSSHTIGKIIREELGFRTKKGTGGIYFIKINEAQIKYLVNLYGVESPLTPQSPLLEAESKKDLMDSVDLVQDIKTKEKKLREILNSLKKNDPSYQSIYSEWFSLREKGVELGIWNFSQPLS